MNVGEEGMMCGAHEGGNKVAILLEALVHFEQVSSELQPT